jgi:hypothetical protein
MLTLSEMTTEGPFFRLTWSDDLFDDTERVHITPAAPLERCYNEILMPLAAERGEQLTEGEVLKALTEATAAGLFPDGKIDWLGLALYGQKRFLEGMGKIAEDADRPEHQAELRAASPLQWLLLDLHIRMGWQGYPARAAGNGQGDLVNPGWTPAPRAWETEH